MSESTTLPIVVVCGLSGAGKSTVSNALEDLGCFCVDNLPSLLLGPLVDFSLASGGRVGRLVLVTTVRTPLEVRELQDAIVALTQAGHPHELIYLEAADETLHQRFSETRRRHPLDHEKGDLAGAIEAERGLLEPLRHAAHHVIDTSGLRPEVLRRLIGERFAGGGPAAVAVRLQSFGFKHGTPRDADLVLDVRFLPNPYFVDELREQTGLDEPVARYVLAEEETAEFITLVDELFEVLALLHAQRGSACLKLAIGCTGGRHRSVALAEELSRRFSDHGFSTSVEHRDVGRP